MNRATDNIGPSAGASGNNNQEGLTTATMTDSQNYEQLAQEIEALDTYWGPTFR